MSDLVKEEIVEKGGPKFFPPLYIQRYTTVRDILFKLPGIRKVVDFGCAEGKFIKYLKKLPFATDIACVDIDESCLDIACNISRPAAWDLIFKRHEDLSIKVFKGSAAESDYRVQGYCAVTCIELIEHLESGELIPLVCNIFGYIRPKVAIFTTPNSEFNILFPQLKGFRHWDHKFEWTREEFKKWCETVTQKYSDYNFEIQGVGDPPTDFSHLGKCSQLAVFKLKINNAELSKSYCCDCPYSLIDEHNYPGRSTHENSKEDLIDVDLSYLFSTNNNL